MSIRGRIAAVAAGLLLAVGIGCSSSAVATCTPLVIPNPLTANYTAPAGTYCPGPQATVKGVGITADLTQATIVGSGTGYLFRTFDGDSFTVKTGTVSNMAGIVSGVLGAGQRSTVTIAGGNWTGVVSGFLYKSNDGGRADVTMTGVTATGMGAGVRTYGSVTATGNDLTGGGNPSSGDPAGFHALDLNTTGTPVADQLVTITGNRIHGFTTTSFQGDGLVSEETATRLVVTGNVIGGNSDTDVDTKSLTAVLVDNTLEANAAGSTRLVAAHFGATYSIGNTYAVQAGAQGIQATAGRGPDATHPTLPGAVSSGDTFTLADSTALIAKAQVQCTGSTGNTGPRAGFIELDHPTWIGGGAPWAHIDSTCTGTSYTTTVAYLP